MIRALCTKWHLPLFGLLFLAACGGGGGGGSAASGVGGTGISSGTITGFGSIIVNGVEFDDNGADILLVDENDDVSGSADDKGGQRGDLHVGMVVEVENESSGNARRARHIRFENIVKGPIQTVDAANNTLIVLGQTVLVDANTSIIGRDNTGAIAFTDITGLNVNDFVEVSGFVKSTGEIVATFIQKKVFQPGVTTLKLKGKVSNLTQGGTTFNINAQVVDFTTAPALITPAGSTLRNGGFVVVKTKLEPVPLGGTLLAQQIKIKRSGINPGEGFQVEVEGVIESIDLGAKTFVVNGVTIDGSALSILGSLVVGQKIEIEGVMRNGILVPTKAKSEQESNIRAEAPIQAIVGAPTNTLTVLGEVFTVNALTRFEDKVSDARPFNFTNFDQVLQVGDRVIVRGFQSNGSLTATRIERVSSRDFVSIQGPLSDKTPNTAIKILGVTVQVGLNTQLRQGLGSLTDLFSRADGTVLKAKGIAPVSTTDVIDATRATPGAPGEVELED